MVDVVVEYDYIAAAPDELTIKKGDVIHEVIKMKGGWWEGVLYDKRGMFPDNFVKELDQDFSINNKRKDAVKMRQCRVLFSYKQDHVDELELNVGDVINIVGEEEEGWWRGMLNGKEGVFPSNFVEEIKSKSGSREDLANIEIDKTPTLPPKPLKLLCQVKYSYKAQNEDELSIKEGDLINLINKDGQDPGWWKGELNGQIGVFPDNFVIIIENIERRLSKSETITSKTSTTVTQRKSVEEKLETDSAVRINPSVSSKKPAVPIKKSPSGVNPQGGILAGLRKKIVDSTSINKNHSQIKINETKHAQKEVDESFIVSEVKMVKPSDVIDGNLSSKSQPQLLKVTEVKNEFKEETVMENAFDHVERSSLLSDVRATRAKAPGRRPPSVIFKDGEPGVVNGSTDHIQMDMLTENLPNSRPSSMSDQNEMSEMKPRVREWEKHKAPWLEEMKLNQAKRTSPSSDPSKLKLTPSDKSVSPESEEMKSPFDKSNLAIDTSVSPSLTNSSTPLPPSVDKNPVVLRHKSPQVGVKPQAVNIIDQHKHDSSRPSSVSSNSTNSVQSLNNKTTTSKPQAACKNPDTKVIGDGNEESLCVIHYMELLQRIEKLETLMELQQVTYTNTIEELKGKILQLENEINPI